MSKGKEVIGMGAGVEDDDQLGDADGGRKRKPRSPNQEEDSSKRLQIQQDLNHSPNQEEKEEAPNPDPELLFEKELTSKDVKHWQIIISELERKTRVLRALNEDEIKKARGRDGLSVATTDADGVEYTLILRIGHYMSLTDQWTNIIQKYKPKAGDSVQAFASRHAADPHFRLRINFITN